MMSSVTPLQSVLSDYISESIVCGRSLPSEEATGLISMCYNWKDVDKASKEISSHFCFLSKARDALSHKES